MTHGFKTMNVIQCIQESRFRMIEFKFLNRCIHYISQFCNSCVFWTSQKKYILFLFVCDEIASVDFSFSRIHGGPGDASHSATAARMGSWGSSRGTQPPGPVALLGRDGGRFDLGSRSPRWVVGCPGRGLAGTFSSRRCLIQAG